MTSSLMRRSGFSSSLNPLSSSVGEDTNTRMVINPIAAHGTTSTTTTSTPGGSVPPPATTPTNNNNNNSLGNSNSNNLQSISTGPGNNNVSNANISRTDEKATGNNIQTSIVVPRTSSPSLARSTPTPTIQLNTTNNNNTNTTVVTAPPSPSSGSISRTNNISSINNGNTAANNNSNSNENTNNPPSVWPKVFQISKRLAMYFSTLVGSGCYTALAINLWGSSETSTAATAILSVLGVTLAANCVLAWLYKAAIDDHDTVSALQNNPPLAAASLHPSSSNPNLLLDGRTIDGGVPGRDPDTELYLTFLFLLAGLHPRHILLYASHRSKPLAYQIQRLPPGSPIPPAPLAPAMLIFAVRWSIAATITIDFVMLIITISIQGITLYTPVASMVLACLLISIFNLIISLTYSVALCSRVRASGSNYGDTINDRNNALNNGWVTPRHAPVTVISDNNGNRNRVDSPGKGNMDANDYGLQRVLHSSSPVIVNRQMSPQHMVSGSSSPLPLHSSDRHARVARTATTASSINGQMNNPRFPSNGTPSLTITASGNNVNARNVMNNKPVNTSVSSLSTPYSQPLPQIPISHSPPHPALHHQLSAPELTSHNRPFPVHGSMSSPMQYNPNAASMQSMIPVMTSQNGVQRIQLIPASMVYGNGNNSIPVSPSGHPVPFLNSPYAPFIPNNNSNHPMFLGSPNASNILHPNLNNFNRSPGQPVFSPSMNAVRSETMRDNASISRRSITGEIHPAVATRNPGIDGGNNILRRTNSVSEQDSPNDQGPSVTEQVMNNNNNDQIGAISSSRKLPSSSTNSGIPINIPMYNGNNSVHNPVHMENMYSNSIHPSLPPHLANTPSIINVGGISYAVAPSNGNANILFSENINHSVNGINNSSIPINMISNEQSIPQNRIPFHSFPLSQGMVPRNVIMTHPSDNMNNDVNNSPQTMPGSMIPHHFVSQMPMDASFLSRVPPSGTINDNVPKVNQQGQGTNMQQLFDEDNNNTQQGTEEDAEYQEYLQQQQQQSEQTGAVESRTVPIVNSSVPPAVPLGSVNRLRNSNVIRMINSPAPVAVEQTNNNSTAPIAPSNLSSSNNGTIPNYTGRSIVPNATANNVQSTSTGIVSNTAEIVHASGALVTNVTNDTSTFSPVVLSTNILNTETVSAVPGTHRRHLQDDDPK